MNTLHSFAKFIQKQGITIRWWNEKSKNGNDNDNSNNGNNDNIINNIKNTIIRYYML